MSHAITYLNNFMQVINDMPEKPTIVFRHAKHHTSAFLYNKVYIVSIARVISKKILALIHYMKLVLLMFPIISINLPYNLAWNTVIISGLVLLVCTQICWISHRNRYVGLLVLHFLLPLNPWFILVMYSTLSFLQVSLWLMFLWTG